MKKAIALSIMLLVALSGVSTAFAHETATHTHAKQQASSGLTYSIVDLKHLPLTRVYDPVKSGNHLITRYSYEHLSYMLENSLNFQRRNDLFRVCDSMHVMFGQVPNKCFQLERPVRKVHEQPVRYVVPQIPEPEPVVEEREYLRLGRQYSFTMPAERKPRYTVIPAVGKRQVVTYEPRVREVEYKTKIVQVNTKQPRTVLRQVPAPAHENYQPVYRPWNPHTAVYT